MKKPWMLLGWIVFALSLLLCGCQKQAQAIPEEPQPSAEAPDGSTARTGHAVPRPWYLGPETETLQHKPQRTLQMDRGTVTVYESILERSGSTLDTRLYAFPEGEQVTMGRGADYIGQKVLRTWTVEGTGFLRWYDSAEEIWKSHPLADEEIKTSMVEITMDQGGSWLIYLPRTYVRQEREVLEYLPARDGTLMVRPEGTGWRLTLVGKSNVKNSVTDYVMVFCPGGVLDWSYPNCGELWKNYTAQTGGRLCFDGYYWPCPDDYEPWGINYYYRNPASYLVKSFAYIGMVHRGAQDLAIAMLDTLALEQNLQGFWETTPRNSWLCSAYGIEGNFYDTRFNTELAEIYAYVLEVYGAESFRPVLEQYADFYADYAETHHWETENGGWLVSDYGHRAGPEMTHCSLNHQLTEISGLYHFSDLLERPLLAELADRMLLAVTDTAEQWVKENGDLHYAVDQNGLFSMPDYPYLTYDDLFRLQDILQQRTGQRNPSLDFLMEAKKGWMDQNGVNQYQK